jgi:glycosyltransferase involved in cell wall biosynthesis
MSGQPARAIQAVHIGISGFPMGPAAINKCKALYGSLLAYNVEFLIINNRPIHAVSSGYKIEQLGAVDGMPYVYTTLSPYKSNSFIFRRLSNLTGRLREALLLIKLGFQNRIDIAFYYPTNGSFLEIIFFRLLSKIFGFKIIAHYVEYRSGFSQGNMFNRWSDKMFDKYFMRWVDAVLPISEFLIQHLKKRDFKGPYLKVPPLVDFKLFGSVSILQQKYFFYVGTAAYMQAVKFMLDAFEQLGQSDYELHLLVNGNAEETERLNVLVSAHPFRSRIKCFSRISFEELVRKYKEAFALLIALTDSVQDTARFPQKISEYLASGNPVITTRNGEVPNYLKDGESALIADRYDVSEFSAKMRWAMENPDASRSIGKRGREIGLKYFDISSYSEELKNLVDSLLPNKKS